MKFYIIGERELVLAFKLTGVDGTIAENRNDVLEAFNRVIGKGGIANVPSGEIPKVLILTESAASQIEFLCPESLSILILPSKNLPK